MLHTVWHVGVLSSVYATLGVILVAVCGLPTSDRLCQLPSPSLITKLKHPGAVLQGLKYKAILQ